MKKFVYEFPSPYGVVCFNRIYVQTTKDANALVVSVPLRGSLFQSQWRSVLNDIKETNVSVPLRGSLFQSIAKLQKRAKVHQVSVPLRGSLFQSYRKFFHKYKATPECFRPLTG